MELYLSIYGLVGIFMLLCSVVAITDGLSDDMVMFFSPLFIYKVTNMNMFGCIICSVLTVIINPIYTILATLIWAIWTLFYVGRKR